MVCDMCGKGRMVGRTHTHHPGVAGGRWKKRAPKTQKIFKPNLHWARIAIDGGMKRMRLCTSCLKRAKEAMKATKQIKTPVVPQTSSQPAVTA